MKFTKGQWMQRKGVQIHSVAQVREARILGNRLYLYTVPYEHDTRAMGGVMIEIFISTPQPDIIRLEA